MTGILGPRADQHTLSLGHGLELRCAMDSLDDSVAVGVAWPMALHPYMCGVFSCQVGRSTHRTC